MQLQTSVKPRRDGTVIVRRTDKQDHMYVFALNEHGDLVCDVDHDPTVAMLLATGDYIPVDEGDYDAALSLGMSDNSPLVEAQPSDVAKPVVVAKPVEATVVPAKPAPAPKAKTAPKGKA